MRMSIRVGNLDPATTGPELEQLCSPYGRVRRVQMLANLQDEGGAVGIVEMRSEQACQAAMAALGGVDYRGRALTISRGTQTHARRSVSGSVSGAQKLDGSSGPTPGGFGDRSGKGRRGGQFYI